MAYLCNSLPLYWLNLLNQEVLRVLQNRCQKIGVAWLLAYKKNYLQINVFLGNGGRVERNFKALLMKAIESLSGRVRREILSSINKSLGGSYSVVMRDWVA